MKQGLFLFVATLLVNILNYGLNIFLARWLGPVGFSEANLIATLVLGLSFAAMGLQLTAAKLVAEKQISVYALLKRKVTKFAIVVSTILIVASPLISSYLKFVNLYSLIILFAGIPFYFLMSMSRGHLQGLKNFRKLGLTYLVEGLVRCVATLGLLIISQNYLSTSVVACGFLLSFILTWLCSKDNVGRVEHAKELNSAAKFLIIMGLYELSQVLINNSDVILVKHHFSAEEAGLYASLAILGKAVFFATWVVVTILFPKVIEKERLGLPHLNMFVKALFIVALIGGGMVLGSFLWGDLVLSFAFGLEYSGMADGLWVYALLTCCFACANVFVYYNLSLERYWPVFISLAIGIAQIFFINLFHGSLQEVITVQLCMMIFFLLTMVVYQFISIQFNQISTKQAVNQIQ